VILAIDPGTEQSGWCVLNEGGLLVNSGVEPNKDVLKRVVWASATRYTVAIEMVASYGMPVGREVFETVRWIGRFQQAYADPEAVRLVYRRDVKIHLCGSMKAKDANVWQALKDRLGEVGTKKHPGPLFGVSSHARSALAVAVTVHDKLTGAQ
jgi:hypothetical protein